MPYSIAVIHTTKRRPVAVGLLTNDVWENDPGGGTGEDLCQPNLFLAI